MLNKKSLLEKLKYARWCNKMATSLTQMVFDEINGIRNRNETDSDSSEEAPRRTRTFLDDTSDDESPSTSDHDDINPELFVDTSETPSDTTDAPPPATDEAPPATDEVPPAPDTADAPPPAPVLGPITPRVILHLPPRANAPGQKIEFLLNQVDQLREQNDTQLRCSQNQGKQLTELKCLVAAQKAVADFLRNIHTDAHHFYRVQAEEALDNYYPYKNKEWREMFPNARDEQRQMQLIFRNLCLHRE